MARLWRNTDGTREGKYLVQRRDGSIPEWPFFVMAASDPATPPALRAYADAAEAEGMDPEYVADIRVMAYQFDDYRAHHATGDPDAPRHRTDDPEIIAKMRRGQSQA
jgi:hypothetical protein